jgi:hypothetical protein
MGSGDPHGSWLIAASNLAGSLLARAGLRDRCRCKCRVLGGIPEVGVVDLLREQLARCDAPRGVSVELVLAYAGAALILGLCTGGALVAGLLRLGAQPIAGPWTATVPRLAPTGAPAVEAAPPAAARPAPDAGPLGDAAPVVSPPVKGAPAPLEDRAGGRAAATPASLGRLRKRPGGDGR